VEKIPKVCPFPIVNAKSIPAVHLILNTNSTRSLKCYLSISCLMYACMYAYLFFFLYTNTLIQMWLQVLCSAEMRLQQIWYTLVFQRDIFISRTAISNLTELRNINGGKVSNNIRCTFYHKRLRSLCSYVTRVPVHQDFYDIFFPFSLISETQKYTSVES
jgi:hypothetical protein